MMNPLLMDARLRGELWLVMPSHVFDALVEEGELTEGVLTVPKGIYEEITDTWGKVDAAFERAGYNVVVLLSDLTKEML